MVRADVGEVMFQRKIDGRDLRTGQNGERLPAFEPEALSGGKDGKRKRFAAFPGNRLQS